ncbi:S46 family peptidase [Massilibacteroides sp.]|uniref:S46 family peptidase n=1 Tax=Massilibacteroides sp. TaxID=2034766 RepID=UPI0026075995|nr:S46 family peptidase [Massilibacteroides sp.]MDD4515539.1 S46 family peptidase [Massilibacteroides sp.]
MKKGLLVIVAAILSCSVKADEGMWILPLLKQQKFAEMQALGLKLQDYDIYSPDSSALKDAVVIFGGGCTGEMVSPEGLLLTNHHCGYSQIQMHSTLEHDYLSNGFWAASREQELPNPGLKVTFIDKIEDVTDYVKGRLAKDEDPTGMNFLSPKYLNGLAKERIGEAFLQNNPGVDVEIKAFYGGNVYYMFTKKIYSDVRLVGAPPSSIGKFGADTDNWMWPRHTGDFSVFRVYADANGEPAEYSDKNVPLRPKRWLKISLKGVQENDFAMMMGFPGRTNKYYTSWEVEERRDIDNTVRINIRELRQEAMLEEMLNDPAIRIQYSSKYASSTNAYKNAIGSSWAINKHHLEEVKKAEQDRLIEWGKKNCQPDYEEALLSLEQLVYERKDLRFRGWMLDEALLRGIEFARVPTQIKPLCDALRSKNKSEQEKQLHLFELAYLKFYDKNYSPEVDRKIAKIMLSEYRRLVSPTSQPAWFAVIDKRFKGDVNKFVDHLFEKSIFGNERNFEKFKSSPSVKALEKDPMIQFAVAVQQEKTALTKALADFDAGYAQAHRKYVEGLLKMYGDKANFPDANFSLRLTYGQVKGYSPSDAVYYQCQTTLDGVMEKEDPDNWEFVVPDQLKKLYAEKNFGRYALPDGRMPVAFSASTHSTGGNSGSPVLNADGELIGINFDRNWEGVGGDIQYLPDYQRSIIVDVRYVLFIIDKYAGAGYLLDEMELSE